MVSTEAYNSRLKLKLDLGVDEDGKVISKTKSFSNVRSDVKNDDLYAIAKTLVNLQEHDLKEVRRTDENLLTEN